MSYNLSRNGILEFQREEVRQAARVAKAYIYWMVKSTSDSTVLYRSWGLSFSLDSSSILDADMWRFDSTKTLEPQQFYTSLQTNHWRVQSQIYLKSTIGIYSTSKYRRMYLVFFAMVNISPANPTVPTSSSNGSHVRIQKRDANQNGLEKFPAKIRSLCMQSDCRHTNVREDS